MNPHIELVKKWLADPDSVTVEELRVNERESYKIIADGSSLSLPYPAYCIAHIVNEASNSAYRAACAEINDTYWIEDCKSMVEEFDSIVAKKEPNDDI
jgi:hypothetical protein